MSDKFIFGIEENDFILDGFQIRKISNIKKVELKDDLYVKINEKHEILKGVIKPDIDLTSWKTIFNSLIEMNKFIIIKNEDLEEEELDFAIGKVISVNSNSISFKEFDSNGVWDDNLLTIPFKWITSVTFNDRYSKTWEDYLTKNQ